MKVTDYEWTYCTTMPTVTVSDLAPTRQYIGIAMGVDSIGWHHAIYVTPTAFRVERDAFLAATKELFDRAAEDR